MYKMNLGNFKISCPTPVNHTHCRPLIERQLEELGMLAWSQLEHAHPLCKPADAELYCSLLA
jgi:hypothetical protein